MVDTKPSKSRDLWHNNIMAKIRVKSHYRNGKYVRGHQRSQPSNTTNTTPQNFFSHTSSLLGIASASPSIVDRKGKVFNINNSISRTVIEGADFSGYSFDDIDFGKITFKNSNLKGVKFNKCKINLQAENSNISDAEFNQVHLRIESLENTSFSNTTFQESSIDAGVIHFSAGARHETGKQLPVQHCDFSESKIMNCHIGELGFNESKMQGMIFENVEGRGLIMNKSDGAGMIVQDTQLENLNVFKSDLSGSLFKNTHFKGNGYTSALINVKLRNATMDNVRFSSLTWKTTAPSDNFYINLLKAIRAKNQTKNLTIQNCIFRGSELSALDLRKSKILSSNFNKTSFSNVLISGLDLSGSSFTQGKFYKTQGQRLKANYTDFSGSTFGANEDGSNFSGSDFSNADFTDTVLNNSNFKKSKWDNANTSEMIIFPDLGHERISTVNEENGTVKTLKDTSYEHYSLHDAAKELGATEKAFEFLVVSGAVEVRHNLTKSKVKENFNTSLNHIPVWQMQNLKKLATTKNDNGS